MALSNEEWVDDGRGSAPLDYKFHVVHQRVVLAQVDYTRFGKHTRHIFDPEWNRLGIEWTFPDAPNEVAVAKPAALDQMKALAVSLSRDFVYVRVDLFLNEDEVVFRELTFAPDAWRSGMFRPSAVNNVLGYMVAHP